MRFFEDECDFHDIVVSAKAHDVQTTIDTYRLLAAELPQVPLHIGVTEAGTAFQGIIKSASGLGVLLEEGIGDTMASRSRTTPWWKCGPAGRCSARSICAAAPPSSSAAHLRALPGEPHRAGAGSGRAPRYGGQAGESGGHGVCGKRAGEAADADIGVACGAGAGVVFSHGKIVRKVQESEIVSALMEELENL